MSVFISPPPLPSPDAIAPRGTGGKVATSLVMAGDSSRLEEAVGKGEGRATLRLKSDGQAVVEKVVS